ncbi:MAG: GIY-YIG nuclease family protein, partial [Chloroflexi bacterium]|nr:GIY-YIG nuclease family protein [Chloroflexota bacterium]
KYYTTRLVYFDETDDVSAAIAKEKEIKGWRRAKKVALIESMNPAWVDLAAEWFGAKAGSRTGNPPLRMAQ